MQESRLLPFTIAGLICFAAAFVLGAGFWFFFGTKIPAGNGNNNTIVQTSNQASANTSSTATTDNSNAQNVNADISNQDPKLAPTPTPEIKKAPAGEIEITGGEVTLDSEILRGKEPSLKVPLRRESVQNFFVGETEVTNAQYAEFVEAAAHKPPSSWKNGKFPPEAGEYPVTGVSWADANDYCKWLSKEIGATVRLPTEAEWKRAARGDTNNKYVWGDQWNDEAAQSLETKGNVRAVKSFPAGRSPYGVYEMIGNVWEWTSDLVVDEFGKPDLYGKSRRRIMKGGSAQDEKKDLAIDVRAARPEDKPFELLGFRYVVIRQP